MKNIWVEANEATSVNKRMDDENNKIAYMLHTDWEALGSYLDTLSQITVDEFITEDCKMAIFKEEIAYDASAMAFKAVTTGSEIDPLWNLAMLAILDTIQEWTK